MPDPIDGLTPEDINPEAKPDFFTAKTQAQLSAASSIKSNINVARSAGMTPDREAKIVSAATRTGLAPATVRELPDHYLDPNAPNPAELARSAPATAAFLAESPTNAAIGAQDWQSLSNIEGWRSALAAEQQRADDELSQQKPPVSMGDAYDQGSRTVEMGELLYRNYFQGDASGMARVAELEKEQQAYAERDQNTSGLRYILNAATEMVPIMGSSLAAGAKTGAVTAMTAVGTAALAGVAGPQAAIPEEVITYPVSAMAGFGIGASTGIAANVFRLESALAAHEMSKVRDLNDQPIDPAIVKTAAVGIGALNAGLEMFGWSKLAGTLPKGWIKSAFGQKAISSALVDPDVEKALRTIAAKYGTAVGAETGTEMAQEVSAILGGWIATHAGELLDGQAFGQEDKALLTSDNLSRVYESGKKAFAASLVFGAPGTAMTTYQQVREVKESKLFTEFLKNTNAAVNESPMQERSPEKMREFLQLAGHGGEAFIDPDTAQKIPAEVLAKVGISPDAVAESDITGQSIPVRLEDLQTKLTPEEFKQVLPGVKAGQRLPSETQAKEFKDAAELARAAEVYDAATLEETQFKQSLKNLRKDITDAVEQSPQLREQIRAQGITAGDFADTHLQLWEGMSRRLALEGRELNETLRKVTLGAVSQAPQLRGAGRTLAQDGVRLQVPKELRHAALRKQWRKAHGDRTPEEGDKAWAKLVAESDAKDAARGAVFNQNEPAGEANANTQIIGDAEVEAYILNIFSGANLSSVVHESAHVFLSELSQVVGSGTASEAMVKDWNAISKWLGVDLLSPQLTEPQYRAAHEQFARGFEEYLREGKAPSPELANAFERFKQWLTKIYKTVQALGPDRVPLTDEVRQTFGRLIATKEEVRASVASNELVVRTEADLAKLGLGPEEKARINELLEQGRARTEQALQRRKDAGSRARDKEWRAEAVRDILSSPVYEAMATIKKGGGLRGVAISYEFGDDTVAALRERGLIASKNADGMQVRDVANTHRFESEEALIVALLDAQPSREAAVQFHVEQQRAAYDATHSVEESLVDAKEYADYMEEMGKYLGRVLKEPTTVSQETFRTIAENRVRNMPMAQAIKSDGALAAMQQALRTERRALARGDFKTALKANDRARLNFEMAKVAKKMRTMLERTQASGNKNARADKGTIEEQHHLNLVAALQRYGLLVGDPKVDLANRKPLKDVLAPVDTDAADPTDLFPDLMVNEVGQPWSGMSANEFEQLSNLLKYLNGRGRALVNDAVAFSELSRTQIADEVTAPIAKLTNKALVSPDSYWGKLIRGVRSYYASLDQFLFVMRRADGSTNVGPGGVAGPNERLIYRPLAAAWSAKKLLSDQVKEMTKPHIQQLRKSMLAAPKYLLNTGVKFPEIMQRKSKAWTFEQVVAIALNMGNEYNRQAVLDGYGLTEADLAALTGVLKPEDWAAIQGIWNAINSLWPQIDAVHYRLNHFHQEKVAANPFITPTGQRLEGGYYPVKFDSELSATVGEWTEADNFMNSTHALFPAPNVSKGFTKARSGTGGKPIALSIRVLGEHLDFATQYITHAEVVKDMDRIMSAKVKGETNPYYSLIAEKMGDDVAKLIRPTLKHIARPEGEILEWVDKILNASKGMATAYILGLNIKTALTNLTGITTVLAEAGAGTVFRGYTRVLANPREAYAEMVKMSPYMASRSQIYDRDVRRQLDELTLDNRLIPGATRDAVKASAFIFLWATDLAMVMPAWWGVYQKELAKNGGDTKAAVTVADEFVSATNPSARPIDLAQLQRSNKGLHRLFTMFSSFTIKYGNRQRLYYSAWKNGQLSGLQYMRHVVLEAMLPSLMTTVGYGMLWGHDPTDEDDLKHTIADLAIYQFQGLPFFRDVIGAGISFAADDYVRDPTKSPVFTGLDLASKMTGSIYRFAEDLEDDAKMEKAVWAFADAVSFKVGLPAPKMFRNLMEGMRQWEEEEGASAFNVLVPDPDAKK